MARPPHKRKIELMLLVAVQVVVVFGLALVFFGKGVTTPFPAAAININTATASEFAQALSVSREVGTQLVALRAARPFEAVFALRHAKLLRGLPTSPIDARFVVRSPGQVAVRFWGGVLLFLLAFGLAHALLRKAAPNADSFLLPLVALLAGVGLMMVYTVQDPYRDTFAFFGQARNEAVFGFIALAFPLTRLFARLTLRRYQYAYAAAAIIMMLLLRVFGHGPGGIPISLGGIEPVEIIKILLVFFVVSYLAERRGTLGDPKRPVPRGPDFLPLGLIYLFTLSLFVLLKDLGPAVLLFGAFLVLLYLATLRPIYPIVGVALLLLAGIGGYAAHFGFFATRVTMWLHPWDNNDPHGAQLAQGLWGMATGGLLGSGLGLGSPSVMPRAGSDLIFATIGEELGLVGTLSVLLVYVLLIARGFRIALCAVTDFDRLLASGLTTLFALQTMIIVGGVTGFVPLTGITLPFISFGASSLVANFFAIGVLLHLSNKTLPSTAADRATPEWARAARTVALGCAVYLLIGIGVCRLMVVQGIADTATATRPLETPDADGIKRPHINPRLLAYAAAIPRGRILDRNGIALARNATGEDDPSATGLLTPDGRRRVYPGGPSCAHLAAAIEAPAQAHNALGQDAVLRGYDTYESLLPYYRRRSLPFAAQLHGDDVTLTIDITLQQAATEALSRYANRLRDGRTGRPKDKGAAVVLDAATGEVLAAASIPTFDPSSLTPEQWAKMHTPQDKSETLLDRAVSGLYPPGSAFKIVTASAALEHGLAGLVFTCHHTDTNVTWRFDGHPYARRRITDEDGFVSHGQTDLAKALRVSCNVYFANLGIALGAAALDQTARQQFQLAHMPPLAKLGEDLPDCAYGQGAVQVTPLEMAHVAQAVANNGQLLPISFVKPKIKATSKPTLVLTPAQAAQMQKMLAGVVTDGTARGVFDGLRVSVAGKTGSAQNAQGDGATHSWFAGFAPATSPTLAFACVIENGGAGRAAAAPACRDILSKAF